MIDLDDNGYSNENRYKKRQHNHHYYENLELILRVLIIFFGLISVYLVKP